MEPTHPATAPSPLNAMDRDAARLRAEHPGWRVWFVPLAGQGDASWHAQPRRYPLNAGDPGELAALIDAAEREGGPG